MATFTPDGKFIIVTNAIDKIIVLAFSIDVINAKIKMSAKKNKTFDSLDSNILYKISEYF